MNKSTHLALAASLMAGSALAEQWTGWIADQKCASTGMYSGEHHKKCVDGGQPVVFVNDSDQKIYKLSDQEKAKAHVGKKVTLTGTAKGDTIEPQTVTASAGS